MSDVILCNISDANDIIAEERNFWIQDVLISLGISEDVIMSADDIDEYLHAMNEFGIEVELKTSGVVIIYKKTMHIDNNGDAVDWLNPTEENIVGKWSLPTFVRKVEGTDVFYEISLNKWSSFNMRLNDE